jgi:hypothetical protein
MVAPDPTDTTSNRFDALPSFTRLYANHLNSLSFLRYRDHLRSRYATMNALDPALTDAQYRLAEIGEILARGLVRLRARQSRPLSEDGEESSVDFSVDQRGHVAPKANLGGAE